MRDRPSVGSLIGYPAGEPCRQLVRYCRRAGCGVLWYGPWPVRMDLEWIRCLSGLPDMASRKERFAHGADLEQTALDGEARRGRADGSGMTGVDVLVGSAAAERARSPPIDRGLRLSMPLSVKSGPSCSQSGDDVDGRTGRTAACESCLVMRTQRPVSVGSPIGRSRPSFGSPCIGYRTGHSGPCSGTSPRP